jgi:hypothetical protein
VFLEKGSTMEINEIKQQTEFLQDVLYQKGYDLGWESALETMEQLADRLWNRGDSATGEMLRNIINRARSGHEL